MANGDDAGPAVERTTDLAGGTQTSRPAMSDTSGRKIPPALTESKLALDLDEKWLTSSPNSSRSTPPAVIMELASMEALSVPVTP